MARLPTLASIALSAPALGMSMERQAAYCKRCGCVFVGLGAPSDQHWSGCSGGNMESEIVDDISYIGRRRGWGEEKLFGISSVDRRHHMYIIGKTGSGKTTLLRNLIVQDLEAGRGVGVLDPHGDLASELLDLIPPWRTSHVAYFDPADREFPVGLNILRSVHPDSHHLVASGLVDAFKNIWREFWGPRLEYILYASAAALLEVGGATLLGVQRILTDVRYRRWVLRQVKDPAVLSFWLNEFEKYDKRFLREAIAPIQNKVGQLLMSPLARNILGQVSPRLDIDFFMDTKRIFIANLSKGRLGEDKSNLLGSLLATQFQLAAMGRAIVPEDEREDFHLYIDEFQNFTTESFAHMLSEARKYRLSLTLSHQYTAQLSERVRHAVFGNVGTLVSFRVGESDGRSLAREFGGGFQPQNFVELGNHEVVVKLLEVGKYREPFIGTTLSPFEKAYGRRNSILKKSRERYAMLRRDVEGKIKRWMGSNEPSAATRRRSSRYSPLSGRSANRGVR